MCVGCHGAPGASPSEIGEGLNPKLPDLSEESEEMNPAELFWITKNGIKMTGMPAFGPTHKDEELWAIVAFLKHLPELSPEEYLAMVEESEHSHAGHDHHHKNANDYETNSGSKNNIKEKKQGSLKRNTSLQNDAQKHEEKETHIQKEGEKHQH